MFYQPIFLMAYMPVFFIAISAALGALHMIAPDHWIPLTVISLKEHYKISKTATLSMLIGFLHGFTSVILSLLVVFIGIYLLPVYYIKVVSILLITAVCFYILLNALMESKSSATVTRTSLIISVLPDLAVLPIIFYTVKFGNIYLVSVSLIYILSSMISITSVILLSNKGFSIGLSKVDPRNFDYIMVIMLALTAIYIFLFS
jgi:hypothetical protein